MAFFDKLKFWKHKEEAPAMDLGMGSATGLDQGNLGFDQQYGQQPYFPTGVPEESSMAPDQYAQQFPQRQFQQPAQQDSLTPTFKPPMNMQAPQGAYPQAQQNTGGELIAAKLDAIKANLESINQRLANIERMAYGEKQPSEKKYLW